MPEIVMPEIGQINMRESDLLIQVPVDFTFICHWDNKKHSSGTTVKLHVFGEQLLTIIRLEGGKPFLC